MPYSEVPQENGGKTEEGESKFAKQTSARTRMRNLGLYLCNPKKKTFLERTCSSWAKITLFYLVLYSCLAGFWAAMMQGFLTTIEDDVPKLRKWQSLIKYNPGMGYRPQPEVEYTLISFSQGQEDSYKKYTQNLKTFLEDYSADNQTKNGLIDCNPGDPAQDNKDPRLACKYDLLNLGSSCTADHHFGYDEGRPCIVLKMNKLFDWTPDAFSNDSVPEHLSDYDPGFVGVSCEGVTDTDKDNIGLVNFYPKNGFDMKYFPYNNQKNYLAPIVMVEFEKMKPGTLVQVWCKVWADNIYHNRNDRAGSVGFELLID